MKINFATTFFVASLFIGCFSVQTQLARAGDVVAPPLPSGGDFVPQPQDAENAVSSISAPNPCDLPVGQTSRVFVNGSGQILQMGSTDASAGGLITGLQQFLACQKYDTPLNGKFRGRTQYALRAWQKEHGLPATGKVAVDATLYADLPPVTLVIDSIPSQTIATPSRNVQVLNIKAIRNVSDGAVVMRSLALTFDGDPTAIANCSLAHGFDILASNIVLPPNQSATSVPFAVPVDLPVKQSENQYTPLTLSCDVVGSPGGAFTWALNTASPDVVDYTPAPSDTAALGDSPATEFVAPQITYARFADGTDCSVGSNCQAFSVIAPNIVLDQASISDLHLQTADGNYTDSVSPGDSVTMQMTVTNANDGSNVNSPSWAPADHTIVSVPSTDDKSWASPDTINLQHPLAPGASDTVAVPLIAPSTPGIYRLGWQVASQNNASGGNTGTSYLSQDLNTVRVAVVPPAVMPPAPASPASSSPSTALTSPVDSVNPGEPVSSAPSVVSGNVESDQTQKPNPTSASAPANTKIDLPASDQALPTQDQSSSGPADQSLAPDNASESDQQPPSATSTTAEQAQQATRASSVEQTAKAILEKIKADPNVPSDSAYLALQNHADQLTQQFSATSLGDKNKLTPDNALVFEFPKRGIFSIAFDANSFPIDANLTFNFKNPTEISDIMSRHQDQKIKDLLIVSKLNIVEIGLTPKNPTTPAQLNRPLHFSVQVQDKANSMGQSLDWIEDSLAIYRMAPDGSAQKLPTTVSSSYGNGVVVMTARADLDTAQLGTLALMGTNRNASMYLPQFPPQSQQPFVPQQFPMPPFPPPFPGQQPMSFNASTQDFASFAPTVSSLANLFCSFYELVGLSECR